MLFEFRKVSKKRKEQAQAWIDEIKEFLNSNPLIEGWYVVLTSGFLGYGPGHFRCNGDAENSTLLIHTRKNEHLMDVHLDLFISPDKIQERLEMAIESRSKNATDTYWTPGPRARYYHEVVLGKNHPHEWVESYQSEWISKNKLARKS